MPAFKILMGLAVLACVAASATFAFEFGWTRGATEVHRWTFAIAGVALDLLKSGLPILGALAWHERNVARTVACWLVFVVLTGLSLWCAYGTTAIQLATKIATQAVATTAQDDNRTKLTRLRTQRDALQFVETSDVAVTTAQEALTAATEQRIAECGEKRSAVRSAKSRTNPTSATRASPWPRYRRIGRPP